STESHPSALQMSAFFSSFSTSTSVPAMISGPLSSSTSSPVSSSDLNLSIASFCIFSIFSISPVFSGSNFGLQKIGITGSSCNQI
ncbi:hypothetical protein PFISCL1PPCAC_1950, partial [Pristionchus fissidentatus]